MDNFLAIKSTLSITKDIIIGTNNTCIFWNNVIKKWVVTHVTLKYNLIEKEFEDYEIDDAVSEFLELMLYDRISYN